MTVGIFVHTHNWSAHECVTRQQVAREAVYETASGVEPKMIGCGVASAGSWRLVVVVEGCDLALVGSRVGGWTTWQATWWEAG